MTYLRIFVVSMICCVSFAVNAQTLTVDSGEHNDFTRLVVPLPVDSEWQVIQEGLRVTLDVTNFDGNFRTTDIFEMVPRDRITDVTANGGQLIIMLGCDCKVASFVAQERFLVIDIAAHDISLIGNTVPPIEPAAWDTAFEVETTSPERIDVLALPSSRNRAQFTPQLRPEDLPLRARQSRSVPERNALSDMQMRLIQALGKAATRGVLTPVPGAELPNTGPHEEQKKEDTKNAVKPSPSGELRQSLNNMRVTSSIDIPAMEKIPQDIIPMAGKTCTQNNEVDVASWANETPFNVQIGNARENLYGEFDKLNPDWAIKLAKIYIHFGFGAEALNVLSLAPATAYGTSLLEDLAHIMEHGVASENSNLHASLDCDTDVALWAILAKDDVEVLHTIDPRAALRALGKLPVHLRSFLAPALSNRFLSYGDNTAAADALRSLERLPTTLPSAAKLAKANIAIDEGQISQGTETLSEVIDDNVSQSPEALIALVDAKLDAGQPIDSQTASLVEAYAKELNTSEIGPALRRAQVLALVRSGQFDQAFEAIEDFDGHSEERAAVELRLQVLEEVTAAAEDIVFLEYVFAAKSSDVERLPAKQKLALANRLLEMGFARRAELVLNSLPRRPLDAQRQLTLARIALQLSQPQKAFAALSEVESEEADTLKASARLMAGQHPEAAILFREANQPEAARDAEWLAWLKGQETLVDDPVFGPAVRLSEALVNTNPSSEGMLQRSDAALQESEMARQTIQDLLSVPLLAIADDLSDE